MSTTFALKRLTSGEGLSSVENIAPSCDLVRENPKTKLRHASRELRQKHTSNQPNNERIEQIKTQLENLLTKSVDQKPKTNQNRIN
jgi:predicted transposase YdaD